MWLSGLPSRSPRFDPWVTKITWRRKWWPTPVFLPGKPHGQRSLVGHSPLGKKRVGHDLETKQQQQKENKAKRGVIVFYILSEMYYCLVAKLCLTLLSPWIVARQPPLFVVFPKQEYWSGSPFPSPGDLLDPWIRLASPAWQVDSLHLSHLGSP